MDYGSAEKEASCWAKLGTKTSENKGKNDDMLSQVKGLFYVQLPVFIV